MSSMLDILALFGLRSEKSQASGNIADYYMQIGEVGQSDGVRTG